MKVGSAQPRRNDLGVVQDEDVFRPKILEQIMKSPMYHLARVAIKDQKARLIALWSRCLGNEFGREVKIELGCEHVVNIFEITHP